MYNRDLKLENILLNKTESGFEVKICDFGCAAIFKDANLF